jgi:hypothetical protein
MIRSAAAARLRRRGVFERVAAMRAGGCAIVAKVCSGSATAACVAGAAALTRNAIGLPCCAAAAAGPLSRARSAAGAYDGSTEKVAAETFREVGEQDAAAAIPFNTTARFSGEIRSFVSLN